MTHPFTPDQLEDLSTLTELCAQLETDLVLIGAMSLLVTLGHLPRYTRDLDLTVALDLDEFSRLTHLLEAQDWRRDRRIEHRWSSPRGTPVDLLPAGPGLRKSGVLLWPSSQTEMTLAGFDLVFAHALPLALPAGRVLRVSPPHITALLKIVAWLEDPYGREKDLLDLCLILANYEAQSDRLFSEVIFEAALADYSEGNAFLLGLDLAPLVSTREAAYLQRFLARLAPADPETAFPPADLPVALRSQLLAFERGFLWGGRAWRSLSGI